MSKSPRNYSSMRYGYGRNRSLSQELTEFAAKRALGRVIDVAVRQAEHGLTRRIQSHRTQPTQTYRKKEPKMFTKSSTKTQTSASNSRNGNGNRSQEKVSIWVNSVFIEAGNKISRIGTGRPLTTYKADAPVDTKDEDYNASNAVSNVIVQSFINVSEELKDGETRIIAPNYAGNEEEFTGFAFEIRKVEDNEAERAAVKADIESSTASRLGSLFG